MNHTAHQESLTKVVPISDPLTFSEPTDPIIVVDHGGDAHKSTMLGSEQIDITPSYLYHLPPFEKMPPATADTFTLHYKQGSALEPGTRLITGAAAKNRVGAVATYNQEKSEVLIKHILARMYLVPGRHQFIKKLIFAMPPQKEDKFSAIPALLQGRHLAEINGQDVELFIEEAQGLKEGEVAMWAMREEGYLRPQSLNGSFDIGQITTDFQITDESDRVIPDTVLTLNYGVRDLLHMIANDPALISFSGSLPDLDLIQQGIKNQTFEYGTTGLNFRSTFHHYFPQWFRHPLQVAKTRWAHYHARRDRTIIVGGIAPLIKPFLTHSDRWLVPHDPQTANLRGMIYAAKRELLL